MSTWKPRTKRVEWPALLTIRDAARQAGQTVVWTNGCFDLLHAGHVASLAMARQLGDLLVVGLNTDASVQFNKGPLRPILTQDERATMLEAVEAVDYVVLFDQPTPEHALSLLQPDIHCKGSEYAPPHGRLVPERVIVESYGGRIEYLPLIPGLSTTDLIRRIHEKTGASRAA